MPSYKTSLPGAIGICKILLASIPKKIDLINSTSQVKSTGLMSSSTVVIILLSLGV
jgi:hypothetical protein